MPYPRSRRRICSRETGSAVPARVHFLFFLAPPEIGSTRYDRSDPGPHSLFSCTPENLISLDGFGKTSPRQLFFCIVRDRMDTGNSIHRTRPHGYDTNATLLFERISFSLITPSTEYRKQSNRDVSARGNAAALAEILCSRDPWRFTVGIHVGRTTIAPSRHPCDPDFSVCVWRSSIAATIRSAAGNQCGPNIPVRASRSGIGAAHSFACKEPV